MPSKSLPHQFHDGVSETASGVQVTENDEALKGWIEEDEARPAGAYGELTARTATTEYQPSLTRPTQVTLLVTTEGNSSMTVFVGGVAMAGAGSSAGVSTTPTITFIVPAGVKWHYTASNIHEVRSSYLTL